MQPVFLWILAKEHIWIYTFCSSISMTNLSFSQPLHCKRCWAYRSTSRSLCELHFLIFLSNRSIRSLASLSAVNPSKAAWRNRSWPHCVPSFPRWHLCSTGFLIWPHVYSNSLESGKQDSFVIIPFALVQICLPVPSFASRQTNLTWLSTIESCTP